MPGAPNMKMYSRDDLMKNNFGTEGDNEEEDEDEEDSFPQNLVTVRMISVINICFRFSI
jgi:hypothetical protein